MIICADCVRVCVFDHYIIVSVDKFFMPVRRAHYRADCGHIEAGFDDFLAMRYARTLCNIESV